MALLSSLIDGYKAERAVPRARKHRPPLLARIGASIGRHAPTWAAFRTFVLTVAGLGLIDTAAFLYALWAGLVCAGISALLLDWKLGE